MPDHASKCIFVDARLSVTSCSFQARPLLDQAAEVDDDVISTGSVN